MKSTAGCEMPAQISRREAAIAIALGILTFIVFAESLHNDFINYDDGGYVTRNPHVQSGLTVKSVSWAFTTLELANWNPLTWLSLAFDFQLFGLRPFGFHFTNVVMHPA